MVTAHDVTSPGMTEQPTWRITYAEIASLAQVKRPVPTTWSRRHADFPSPVAHEDGRPQFDARAVVEWLTTTGHGNTDPHRLRAELALHTLSAWRSPALPASVLVGALTALICLRGQLDTALAGRDADSLLSMAARLDEEDQLLLSELRDVPGRERTLPALGVLTDELCEAAYTPSEAFEWVLGARHRINYEPADEPTELVVQALAALSGIATLDEGSIVAIPHARTGDLLAALHGHTPEGSSHTYLATEPDPSLVRLVRRRMLVRGVHEFQLDVTQGEDLSASVDAWGDPDLLLCALPYVAAETRRPEVFLDQVQGLTDYLATGSAAVVLGPADALVGALPRHGDADRLRRNFLRDGLLKAVVNLPEGTLPRRPGYRTAIWILARTAQMGGQGHVLLADLSASSSTKRVLDALAEDVATARADGWRGSRRHKPHHAAVVPVKALDDRPGSALTPPRLLAEARFTRAVNERPANISELEQRLAELQQHARLWEDLPVATGIQAVMRPEGRPVRRTTVRQLLAERRLRKRPGHRMAPEHLTSEGHYPVLGPEEILGAARIGSRRIDRGLVLTAYDHAQFTEPEDLVVTASPNFGVQVDTTGLSVVLAPARVLRVRPDADPPVRPRVLAALLRAAAAERARTTGAIRASSSIEDLDIPDLERTEADRYEAALAQIESQGTLLREQSEALDDLTRITAAGIVDGTLTIIDLPGNDG